MKNNKLSPKIYISLLIISVIVIIVLSIIGNKNRIGYLGDFKLNINRTLELNNLYHIKDQFIKEYNLDEESLKNYIFTNENIRNYEYSFKVQYYNRIFKHSDIYGLYIDTNKVLKDNDFIKEIDINNGSPFGNLISSKKIESDKIDNVNYILKIKTKLLMSIIFVFFIVLISYIIYINRQIFDKYIDFSENNYYIKEFVFFKKYNISNILFIIYIIIFSLIVLASSSLNNLGIDDWIYSTDYNSFYQIYDFHGYFWQRGRHFADILMSLNMRPFGNILINLFNIEPITAQKITITIFTTIYFYLLTISLTILVWILNNKNNYKLIFIIISLYNYYLSLNTIDYIYISAYIGSAGFSLLIFLPIIYYFYNNKELIFTENKIIYYSLLIHLIYFATFTLETTSLVIAGLSFFMILYFFVIKSVLKNNNIANIKFSILLVLMLTIIFSSVSFILTLFGNGGRGESQLVSIKDTSIFSNIAYYFNKLLIFEKVLIILSILSLIVIIIVAIKNKKISALSYIIFSILLVNIIGIFGFFAIRVSRVNFELLLIFSVFVLILLKMIRLKNIVCSFVSSFLIIFIIFSMFLNVLKIYDDKNNNYINPKYNFENSLVEIYKDADKQNKNIIIITEKVMKDFNLQNVGLGKNKNDMINRYISNWMYRYGYTKKYIPIIAE
ncbi:hypothetical protein [Brachyspira alvinipulli]|uniref:hypothetical protein n=1 Tax=Brachyspira alvinipulli TaxID=84379 RepID=UPI0004831309|nr:hypothetical protein [Brachyspira alvinipulli]